MKTASAKNKGRTLQKFIVRSILDNIPGLADEDVTSTSMGASGADVKLSAIARKKFPFAVEAKNQEKVSLWAAWEQCLVNAAKEKLYPLLVIKKNNKHPVVVIDLPTFMYMAYKTYGKEENSKEKKSDS